MLRSVVIPHTDPANKSSSYNLYADDAMSRPMYPEPFLLQTTPRYCDPRSQPPPFASEPVDLSLFSTILLVVALAVGGAFFIMAVACFLGEDHTTSEFFSPFVSFMLLIFCATVLHPPADGAHALLWAVKQSTRGCASMC